MSAIQQVLAGAGGVDLGPGGIWTTQPGAPSLRWKGVCSDTTGQNLIAVANTTGSAADRIYKSTDYGVTWSLLSNSPTSLWTDVACDSTCTRIIATRTDGNPSISTNGGSSWSTIPTVTLNPAYSVDCSPSGQYWVSARSCNHIYVSSDYGSTWSEKQPGFTAYNNVKVKISSNGQRIGLCAYGRYITTSANAGSTWAEQAGSVSTSFTQLGMSDDGAVLVASVNGGQTYSSRDYGVNWTSAGLSGAANAGTACSPDGARMVATSGSYSYTSKDSGVTWTSRGTGVGANAINYSGDGKRIIVVSEPSIYTSA